MHVTLAVLVPACAVLCDWQVHRALSGNDLSWAYVFEWPFFAGYGVYVWWRLVHEQLAPAPPAGPVESPRRRSPRPAPSGDPGPAPADQDEELAAYNRYLAQLHASGRRSAGEGVGPPRAIPTRLSPLGSRTVNCLGRVGNLR